MKKLTVGFDVDGTLITFEDKPRYEIINLLLTFKKMGANVFVASGGGQGYAQQWCDRLGIDGVNVHDKHSIALGKVGPIDIWFDDESDVELGRVNIQI